MPIPFRWEEKYAVGNGIIDEQHKHLLEIASSLPDEINTADIQNIILQLSLYTKDHFAAEEELMAEVDYPALPDHKDLHINLVSRLKELSAQPFDDNDSIQKFKRFVYVWIIDHIMEEDKKWAKFIQEKRSDESEYS